MTPGQGCGRMVVWIGGACRYGSADCESDFSCVRLAPFPPNFRRTMHTPASRERANLKVKTKRDAWFLANGPCACGSWINLELHHVNSKTKISHRIWSWCDSKREAELTKCVTCCRLCHQKISAEEHLVGHGHIATYRRGCKCGPCREIKSIENAKRVR